MPYRTFRRQRYYRRRRPIRRKSVGKKCRISKCVKKYVKNTLHRQIENKFYTRYTNLANMSAATSATPFFQIDVSNPPIAQGSTSSTRVGNQIRVVKANLNMCFNMTPYNATTNPNPSPIYIKMWLVSYRLENQLTSLSLSICNTFFKTNNGNIAPQGNLLDMEFEVDEELFKVHASRTICLGQTGGVGTNVYYSTTSTFDNNKSTARVVFPCGKLLGMLRYNDASSSYTTNKNLWLIAQPVNANGLGASIGPIAQCTWMINYHYEDA